jgi:hypothetical protein
MQRLCQEIEFKKKKKKKDGKARYSLEGALARKGSKRAEYTGLNVIPPVRKGLGGI